MISPATVGRSRPDPLDTLANLAYTWPMVDIFGTYMQGQITTSYTKLVETFGEPNAKNGYKTQAEWALITPAGDVVTIYDYKQGSSYRGDADGIPVEDVTDWHIGGHTASVTAWVEQQLSGQA